mgnify:FL=1
MRDGSKAVQSAVEEVDHLNGDGVAKMTNRREGRPSNSNLKIRRIWMASPSKTEEEEGGGKRPRIVREILCRRSGEEPSTRNPENSAVGPVRPRETEEMEDGSEESWHDASEDGWETAYEEVEDGAAKKRKEMRVGAGGSKIGSQPVPGPNRTAFRFGWRAIRIWIVRQGRCSA